jgi:hypothetical protein
MNTELSKLILAVRKGERLNDAADTLAHYCQAIERMQAALRLLEDYPHIVGSPLQAEIKAALQ